MLFRSVSQSRYKDVTSSDSIKDEDYEYNGNVHHPLKRPYIDMEDVGEYEFSAKYLFGL